MPSKCFRGDDVCSTCVSTAFSQPIVLSESIDLAVQCETCARTLYVRDRALVGTIATCPACGSMVQIPEQDVAQSPLRYGDSSIESDALTAEAIEADGIDPGAPPIESGRGGFKTDLSDGAATTSDYARSSSQGETDDQSSIGSSAIEFQSESSQRARKYAAIAAGLILGLAVLGVAISAWMSRKSTEVARQGGPDLIGQDDTIPDGTIPDGTVPDGTVPDGTIPNSTIPDGGVPDEPATAANDSKLGKTSALEAGSDSPSGLASNSDNSEPVVAPVAPLPGVKPPGEPPVEPPTGLPPLSGPIDLFSIPAEAAAADPDAPTLDAMPAGLGSFVPLLLGIDPAMPTDLEAPPSLDDFRLDEATRDDGPLISADAEIVRPKKDLALKVAIQAEPRTVSRWVYLMSQLSGVPIEIDLIGFDLANVDLRKPIAPKPTIRPLYEILDELVESIDGVIETKGTYLSVTPSKAIFEKAIGELHAIKDLEDASPVIDSLMPPKDPPVEDVAVGENEPPTADRNEQILRSILTQSLRVMRGLEPKMDAPALSRWAGPIGSSQLEWRLMSSPETVETSLYPITVSEFFGQIETATNASLTVYWPDMLEREWTASHLVFPDSTLQPSTLIQRTLAPVHCNVRVIDEQYGWVGTDATYDRLPVVVYATELGDGRASLIGKLQQAAAVVGPEAVRWTPDPVSDGMLMVLPRFVAKQLTP